MWPSGPWGVEGGEGCESRRWVSPKFPFSYWKQSSSFIDRICSINTVEDCFTLGDFLQSHKTNSIVFIFMIYTSPVNNIHQATHVINSLCTASFPDVHPSQHTSNTPKLPGRIDHVFTTEGIWELQQQQRRQPHGRRHGHFTSAPPGRRLGDPI